MKILTEGNPIDDGRELETLDHLLGLPHKILRYHDVDGLAHMVLHELGHNNSFGFSKAGYLVDNPDFDCLRGIAGYNSDECRLHNSDVWKQPEAFTKDMKDARFNQQVASFLRASLPRKGENEVDEKELKALGTMFGMRNPQFCLWPMKHGNFGVLLFEDNGMHAARRRNLLHNFSALLSLC